MYLILSGARNMKLRSAANLFSFHRFHKNWAHAELALHESTPFCILSSASFYFSASITILCYIISIIVYTMKSTITSSLYSRNNQSLNHYLHQGGILVPSALHQSPRQHQLPSLASSAYSISPALVSFGSIVIIFLRERSGTIIIIFTVKFIFLKDHPRAKKD